MSEKAKLHFVHPDKSVPELKYKKTMCGRLVDKVKAKTHCYPGEEKLFCKICFNSPWCEDAIYD